MDRQACGSCGVGVVAPEAVVEVVQGGRLIASRVVCSACAARLVERLSAGRRGPMAEAIETPSAAIETKAT